MANECVAIMKLNINKLKSGVYYPSAYWKHICQLDYDDLILEYADLLRCFVENGEPEESRPFVECMECELLFNKSMVCGDKEKAAAELSRYKTITNRALEGMMSMETGLISIDLMQKADVAETVVKEGAIHSCGVIWMLRREQYECLLTLL